jgi:hypothetical protein
VWFRRNGKSADLTTFVFKDQDLAWNFEKSFSSERKADHNSSRLRGISGWRLWSFSTVGIGGTLSVEVLGVDRLSVELLGKLLVEELAEVNVVKLMSTLCGLCLIFSKVDVLRARGFGGLSEVWIGVCCFSNLGGGSNDLRGLEDVTVLAVIFGVSSCFPSCSVSLPLLAFGDGDLDEAIHDFRNVANDSDTVLVLSRGDLEIEGTGGISLGVISTSSGDSVLSGDPFTRCIQDLGRVAKDFFLPTRSSFGRSSFVRRFPSFPLLTLFWSPRGFGETSAETTRLNCSSASNGPLSSAVRQLKLADRGSSSSCRVGDRLYWTLTRSGMFEEECERRNAEFESRPAGIVITGPCIATLSAQLADT